MNAQYMLNQILILREICDAVGALDLMQRVVVFGELVSLQLVEPLKLLRTFIALVRLVAMLYLDVLAERERRRETSGAAAARDLRGVRLHDVRHNALFAVQRERAHLALDAQAAVLVFQVEVFVQRRLVVEQHIARLTRHAHVHVMFAAVVMKDGGHACFLLVAFVTLKGAGRGAHRTVGMQMRQYLLMRHHQITCGAFHKELVAVFKLEVIGKNGQRIKVGRARFTADDEYFVLFLFSVLLHFLWTGNMGEHTLARSAKSMTGTAKKRNKSVERILMTQIIFCCC